MRLLLVEDDDALAQTLSAALTAQHYVVDVARDGEEGWDYGQAFTYDLMLLDVSLPKLDGISLCRRLRQFGYSGPILLLTAKAESADKVAGLDAGADDYVVKPCTVQELFARIRALLRRPKASGAPVLEWGDLRLDPSTCECSYKGVPLSPSPKEYSLLLLFLRHPRRVLSRSTIMEHLWSFEDPPGEDTVRAHIKGLRRKLKEAGTSDVIETVYGLGYRLKPLTDRKKTKSLSAIAPTNQAVAEAWQKFKQPILDRISILEQAAVAIKTGTLTSELLKSAQTEAHKLVGSLGMFGFQEAGHLARVIDDWLEEVARLIASGNEPSQLALHHLELASSKRNYFQKDLQATIALLREEIQGKKGPDSSGWFPEISKSKNTNNLSSILLVVDGDIELTSRLLKEAENWHMRLVVARDSNQAKAAIDLQIPDVVLLDPAIDRGLVLLETLTAQFPDMPVLCWAQQDELSNRLAVVRLGAKRYLPKPVKWFAEVFEVVEEVLQASGKSEAKVLAVDDDRLLLKILRQFLEPYGVQLHTLADPRQFWQALEKINPDLLILDVEMPHFNGIELCQIVRNDSTWSGLPIIFITAHRDSKIIDSIYQAGADDYISKPVREPELVTRIFNRLERTRLLLRLEEVDQLTGVATRRNATKQLNQYLDLCQHHHQPLCLAILDLDNFKRVNDQYGHIVGDQVLQRLGKILQQHFRSEDIVARWGGQEFLVGMYGMTKLDGATRLNEVLQIFRTLVFRVPGIEQLQVTFSAGVAEYPENGTSLHSLYLAADGALHEAKATGRATGAIAPAN
ncbi:MAG: response regulator [Hormoscilla sp.]